MGNRKPYGEQAGLECRDLPAGIQGLDFCKGMGRIIPEGFLMKWILFLALFLATASAPEVKVYKGTSSYLSDILYTVRGGKVYKGRSNYTSDIRCTIRGHEIYKGTGNYRSDVLYTVRDGKVYKGTSQYISDILLTVRDGKVYRGTSTYTSDILATVRDGKVYKGTSMFTSDILFTLGGPLTLEEFVAVWHAVMYVW